MLLTDHTSVNQVLTPIKLKEFTIPNEGTTKLANTGRVGNWIEQQFGIKQNPSTLPDSSYAELKTLGVTRQVAPASIGNVTWEEYSAVRNGMNQYWCTSQPYKKMQRTLWVFWDLVDPDPCNPVYKIRSWHYVDLDSLPMWLTQSLDADYQKAAKTFKRRRYENAQTVKGRYLTLGTKGDSQYVYPNWKFTVRFVRCVLEGVIGTELSNLPAEVDNDPFFNKHDYGLFELDTFKMSKL